MRKFILFISLSFSITSANAVITSQDTNPLLNIGVKGMVPVAAIPRMITRDNVIVGVFLLAAIIRAFIPGHKPIREDFRQQAIDQIMAELKEERLEKTKQKHNC